MLAAREGRTRIVKKLIRAGARANLRNQVSFTPTLQGNCWNTFIKNRIMKLPGPELEAPFMVPIDKCRMTIPGNMTSLCCYKCKAQNNSINAKSK